MRSCVFDQQIQDREKIAMPIYTYKCSSCGKEQDVLRKISDASLTVCPSCGKETLVKQLTAPGFQLKGSGWYATDFRGGNKPAAANADAKADTKTELKTDTKTTSEPAKTEAKPAEKASAASKSPAGSGGNSTCN
jgi:putative FmdB family regulatory protein